MSPAHAPPHPPPPRVDARPVLTLDALLARAGDRPDPAELLRDFVPPPRFASKRFETYLPRAESQAAARDRLREVAERLGRPSRRWSFLGRAGARDPRLPGVYLDGGFGVGKTHLLASLWHAAPQPRAYLSFDELMFFVGLVGPARAAAAFRGYRLIAVDEWELDDPGNLKLALAFLRGALAEGAFVAVTSNTVPLELGAGRFSQKDFRAEVEELAAAFEIVRIEGVDYRRRHFTAGVADLVTTPSHLAAEGRAAAAGATLRTPLDALLDALGTVHPIHFRTMAKRIELLVLDRVEPIPALRDALRWVHFVDSIYVAGTRMAALESVPLGDLFTVDSLQGPFGKKLLRCVSRMEEMLTVHAPGVAPHEPLVAGRQRPRTAD